MPIKSEILTTIQLIRESFDGSVEVYTKGSCVKLAMLLKHLYPEGQVLYDMDHAIFEYNGTCFDITGEVRKTNNHIPLEEYGLINLWNIMSLKASVVS